MKKQIPISILFIVFFALNISSQCSYNILNINHIDCHGQNTGEINVSITNSSSTYWWIFPDGSNSATLSLTNLYAGEYVINIMENMIPGDTTSSVICFVSDTISVEETIEITANFMLRNNCSLTDSVDVTTIIYGGTSPYSTLWTQIGDTNRNINNLPSSNIPYVLNITDLNGCQSNQYLTIEPVESIHTFMMNENVICKDDNSGSVRVFVENGTPPFKFIWSTGDIFMDYESSQIDNLYPGTYKVFIQDTMGCIAEDSIEIATDPKACIKIYKVFSPNDDGIHDYWEIENIHLYPNALIEVYDRLGNRVYRRRNYLNSESVAFNGRLEGRRLPSGTYYYILDLENGDGVFKGTLTLVR